MTSSSEADGARTGSSDKSMSRGKTIADAGLADWRKLVSVDAIYTDSEGIEHLVEWVTEQDGNKGIICVA